MATASARPRYAPEDPTLPKPWRALIDGNTDNIYFWNPKTNVTTYVKPPPENPPPPVPKPDPKQDYDTGNGGGYHRSEDRQDQVTGFDHSNSFRSSSSAAVEKESLGMHVSTQTTIEPFRGKRDAGGLAAAETYRRQHEITVTENVPHPFTTFESTGFPSEILREAQRAGFSAPSPIQAQSWPITMEGRDIVAVAKTGSGKTLGYMIPAFIHIRRLQNNSKIGPTVLVLSPTRELATQIQDEAEKFGSSSNISSVCLYGGAPKGPQLRELSRGVDVVIATPGRLNDILEMQKLSLNQISYLVLDEADRMLDMGFEPQIRKIVKEIPPRRQTLMFTATWPKEVRKIAADLLANPVQVNIGNIDQLVANKSITQHVEVITSMEKQRRLEQILRNQEPGSRVIIFCATKRMCDQLARNLTRSFGAAAIHGDKNQSERDSVLAQFRNGNTPVLVATDVAARGLDVKDIRVVVNYDFPTGIEDYVHRIGRTGRAGAKGEAYTFFCDQDSKYASGLVKILEGASQQVPAELRSMASRGGYGGGGFGGRSRWGSSSGSFGGGRSQGGRGGGNSYGGNSSSSYGRGGYGDQKPSYDRGDGGQGWSHDNMMGSGGSCGRSRSRSPVRNFGSGSSGW